MNPRRPSGLILIVLAAPLTLGCGQDWKADTHPASGRVSIDGQAAAGVLVQLHPVGNGPDERNSRPWALVQGDGTFTLSTYQSGDGAPAGEYAVTLTWPDDPSVPSMTDRLGSRYAEPARSPWKVAIREGENTLEPIEIPGPPPVAKRPKGPSRPPTGPEMLGITGPDANGRR